MKASELINRLHELMDRNGDQSIELYVPVEPGYCGGPLYRVFVGLPTTFNLVASLRQTLDEKEEACGLYVTGTDEQV